MGYHTDVRRERDRRHAQLAAKLARIMPGADPGFEGALEGATRARIEGAYRNLRAAFDRMPPGPARDALQQAYRWARKALHTEGK